VGGGGGGGVTGGVLMGGLGIGWLYYNHAWSWFLEMQLDWNREYLENNALENYGYIIFSMVVRLFPYSFIHLAAIPTALVLLIRQDPRRHPEDALRLRLLSSLYLAWCLQVILLQHPFDYVHFPPMLLGITLLTYWMHCTHHTPWLLKSAAVGFVALALICSPVTRPDYLRLWTACFEQGSSSSIRNELARIPYPDWEELERVAHFLQQEQAQDREVTCYSNDMVHLFLMLDLEPSTRFVYTQGYSEFYPSRKPLIDQALQESPQRFVLTNLMAAGLLASQAKEIGPEGESGYPPAFPERLKSEHPWNLPIAFRSGTLVVHHSSRSAVKKPDSPSGPP